MHDLLAVLIIGVTGGAFCAGLGLTLGARAAGIERVIERAIYYAARARSLPPTIVGGYDDPDYPYPNDTGGQ
jgi:hypothetical protein